jgi:hypothetical protein
VRRSLNLLTASSVHAETIRKADLMALATERRDLVREAPTPWPILTGVQPIGWVRLNSPERTAHGWEFWRDRFLDRFHELEFARNERIHTVMQHDGSEC